MILDSADDGQVFAGMFEAGEGLEEVRNAFAEADLTSEEDLKRVGWRWLGAAEAIETNTVGNNVDLFCRNAHFDERAASDRGGDRYCIGGRVNLLFAASDVRLVEGLGQLPSAIFFGEDLLLKSLVCGTAVANKDPAVGLNLSTGEQTGAGDADEDVAGDDAGGSPAIEGESVPRCHLRRHARGVERCSLEKIVGRVEVREAAYERVRQAFALESRPGPGGIDLREVIAFVELMREFEMMEDSKDGLGNSHEVWVLSEVMLAEWVHA